MGLYRWFACIVAVFVLCVSGSIADRSNGTPTKMVPSAHTFHILVDTEPEVDAIMDKLIESADLLKTFGEVAAQQSKCPSGKKGGDLGWHREGMMVPEFDAAVFHNKIRTLHKVKTQYGWHVVYTTEMGEMEVEDTWHRFFVSHLNTAMPFISPIILIIIMFFGSRQTAQKPGSRARASHILVKTEAEADEIYKQLIDSSEPKVLMVELAAQKSSCPSKNKGGDLGLFARGQMVPAFEKVAFNEAVGSIHKVETQFGWHVVMVTDRIGEKFDNKPQETKKEDKKQQ